MIVTTEFVAILIFLLGTVLFFRVKKIPPGKRALKTSLGGRTVVVDEGWTFVLPHQSWVTNTDGKTILLYDDKSTYVVPDVVLRFNIGNEDVDIKVDATFDVNPSRIIDGKYISLRRICEEDSVPLYKFGETCVKQSKLKTPRDIKRIIKKNLPDNKDFKQKPRDIKISFKTKK